MSKSKKAANTKPELARRIFRLRKEVWGGSQTALAERVGAQRQTTVAAWESGDNTPEPKMLVQLAILASEQGLHSDAIWFLGQAGITAGQLKKFVPGIRDLDRKVAGAGGAYAVPVRPKEYFLGDPGAVSKIKDIALPAEIVDDHTSTSCLVIDKDIGGFAFPQGDMIVIDESHKKPQSCWGEAVLIAQRRHREETEELSMGSLDIVPFVPGEYQRWAVTLSRLTGGPLLSDDLVTGNEGRLMARFMSIDYWNLQDKTPKLDPNRLPDEQMEEFAREKYQIGRGSGPAWRILGRIVGWLREKRK